MLSRKQKLELAKAKKAKEQIKPQRLELSIKEKELISMHDDFNKLAILLQNTLTDNVFKDDVAEKLTELNNNVVFFTQALGEGLFIKNQPVFDEVTVKNLKDIQIPEEITVKNPTELPADLATNKNIKHFQEAIVKALKEVKKAVNDSAPLVTPTPDPENPGTYRAYRRVIVRNGKAQFDDSAISNLRIPVPLPTYQNSLGQPMRPTLNGQGDLGVVDVAYAQKITVNGTTTYIAVAPVGSLQSSAVWQVKQITVSGNDTIFTWADGNANFDNVATDLTALSYS